MLVYELCLADILQGTRIVAGNASSSDHIVRLIRVDKVHREMLVYELCLADILQGTRIVAGVVYFTPIRSAAQTLSGYGSWSFRYATAIYDDVYLITIHKSIFVCVNQHPGSLRPARCEGRAV
jgi:hypothetical protein